ncbi:MAG: type III-A CRISPR-associated RAMP protein Csm4 [Aquificaceae bacterium]|nr:type III-A CRISPR-associated RAMP protein Csm4 [Aquificaceae bacterium]
MKLVKVLFLPKSSTGSPLYSFTIFGAICWSVKYLYGQETLERLLEDFKESPPFLLSDPLPVVNEKLYFPKPLLPEGERESQSIQDYKRNKKLKKLKFVSEEVFKDVLKGNIRSVDQLQEEDQPQIKRSIQLHASINRLTWTTAGGEFFSEFTYYYTPFVVLIRVFKDEYEKLLKATLFFTRFGANRSVGMGSFEVKFEELKEHWLLEYTEPNTDRVFLLSGSFYDINYDLQESYYEVKTVRSCVDNYYQRLTVNIWKKRLPYITAGAQLKVKEKRRFYGGLKVALKEGSKEVYQYGYGFPLFARG